MIGTIGTASTVETRPEPPLEMPAGKWGGWAAWGGSVRVLIRDLWRSPQGWGTEPAGGLAEL